MRPGRIEGRAVRTTAVTRALAAAAVWGCCSGAVAHAQSTPEDRIVAFADIRAAVFKVATLTGMVVALELSDGAARPIHDDGTCPGCDNADIRALAGQLAQRGLSTAAVDGVLSIRERPRGSRCGSMSAREMVLTRPSPTDLVNAVMAVCDPGARPIMDVRDRISWSDRLDPDRRSELLGIMETRPDVLRGFATIRDLLNGWLQTFPDAYWSITENCSAGECHVEVAVGGMSSRWGVGSVGRLAR